MPVCEQAFGQLVARVDALEAAVDVLEANAAALAETAEDLATTAVETRGILNALSYATFNKWYIPAPEPAP